ncbi:hypothetical protein [Rhabdochlamydiaceae symbiont of Dictyostelium giganteum]|uniref:hypothetical protein n=1 Tax=Rhabdochlamydiaceae symbiont of Dictyostelium giganteum TaxID=3342349 RepID=UPI00384E2F01
MKKRPSLTQPLLQQALLLLQEMMPHTQALLAKEEEVNYFKNAPLLKTVIKPLPPPLLPPLPSQVKSQDVAKEPSKEAKLFPPLEEKDKEKDKKEEKKGESPKDALSSKPSLTHDHDLKKLLEKVFPDLILNPEALSDHLAKKMENLWDAVYLQSSVVILFFEEHQEELSFLKNLCRAISHLITPASLLSVKELEKEGGFDLLLSNHALEFVICPPLQLWKTTMLAQYYRQNSATLEHFLNKKPLFLLEPIQAYLHHPQQKQLLWKSLNTYLSSSILRSPNP